MRKKLFFVGLIVTFVLSGIAHYAHWNEMFQFVIASIAVIFVAGFLGRRPRVSPTMPASGSEAF